MAWLAVDKDGSEWIYNGYEPHRHNGNFFPTPNGWCSVKASVELPKDSIKKLIGRDLFWEDEPIELEEE